MKFFYLFLSFSFLFVACSKEPENNGVAPEISNIRFNVNTKIAYLANAETNTYDTILVNPEDKDPNALDTLLLNNPVLIRGDLKSENGLTNMKVMIYGDTMTISPVDTCINISVVPRTYFFGQTEASFDSVSVVSTLQSSFNSTIKEGDQYVTKNKPVRQGGEYEFDVYCIDKLGNINNTTYRKKSIVILSVDSIVSLRVGK